MNFAKAVGVIDAFDRNMIGSMRNNQAQEMAPVVNVLGILEYPKLWNRQYPITEPPRGSLMFTNVIVDECRNLRNVQNTFSHLVATIPKRLLLMSATPTLNAIQDIKGIASQFWEVMDLPISPHGGELGFLAKDYEPGEFTGRDDEYDATC
ncbi:hypothetical protein EKO27_g9273 [Xylaria grammica]|uniref:Helicase ATP-binding domain-containing protein n=1 Tax=Xylaria grammica TaxID=363999 RepID=A0A439CUH9_9PEZI|nr:hypothetical protein EKO27_g9273 [Xylaria grammica]